MALFKKIFSKSVFTSILIIGIVFTPISASFSIQKAEAQYTVFDPINLAENAGTYAKTAVSAAYDAVSAAGSRYLVLKEGWLDRLAWQMVNIAIKEMIRSTTKWVASGFKGSPAFVTDLDGFMIDIADKVAGNFIWSNESLRFLCSPFSLNIKLALDIQYRETRAYEAQCTLSDVIENADQFLAGDFMQGGWDGWYTVTMIPQNNVYGAMLNADRALTYGIAGAQAKESSILSFGNGFLSVRDPNCKPIPDETDDFFDDSKCGVVTPGVVVEGQLNDALGLPGQRLVVADEINELLGALFSQLAGQALSGAGGLLGLTESGYGGGSGNYFDQISAQQENIGYANTSNPSIADAINVEQQYLDLQTQVVDLITDARNYKNERYPDREVEDNDGDIKMVSQCSVGALTNSLTQKLANAEQSVTESSAMITILQGFNTDYNLLSSNATSPAILTGLLTKYRASSVAEASMKLSQEYLTYQSSGNLHTEGDLVDLELTFIRALKTEITTFKQSIDDACRDRNDRGD